jgi:hypothetical protein
MMTAAKGTVEPSSTVHSTIDGKKRQLSIKKDLITGETQLSMVGLYNDN